MSVSRGAKMLGVECPECGGLRTGVAKAGLDSEGHRIRGRACKECNHHFTTIEIPVPFVFNRMDVTKPEHALKQLRGKSNYTAVPRRIPDHFRVTHVEGDPRHHQPKHQTNITFVPGKNSDWCRKGLHKLVEGNLDKRPGKRQCRECRRENQRAYRAERAARFPVIAAEEREVHRMRSRDYRARKKAEQQEQEAA